MFEKLDVSQNTISRRIIIMEETREQKIQKWKLLIIERLNSGMSVRQFCEARGYTENMYYHWVNAIHKADPSFDTRRQSTAAPSPMNSFIEIKADMPRQRENTSCAENVPVAVFDAGSVSISLFSNATAPFMRELLEAVRHA